MLLNITKKDTDLARKLCSFKDADTKEYYENIIILEVLKRYLDENFNVEVTDGLYKLDLDIKPDLFIEGSRVYLDGTRRKGLKLCAKIKDARNIEFLGYKKDNKLVEIDNIAKDVEPYEVDLIENEDIIYQSFVKYLEGEISNKDVIDALLKYPFLKSEYMALFVMHKISLGINNFDIALEDSTLDIFTSEYSKDNKVNISIDVSEDGNTINDYDEEFKEEEAFILEEISSGEIVVEKRKDEIQDIHDIEELDDYNSTLNTSEDYEGNPEQKTDELYSKALDELELELENDEEYEIDTDELIELSDEIIENHQELLTEDVEELETEAAELLNVEDEEENLLVEDSTQEDVLEENIELLEADDSNELFLDEQEDDFNLIEQEEIDEKQELTEQDESLELDFSDDLLEELEGEKDDFIELENITDSQEDVLEFIDEEIKVEENIEEKDADIELDLNEEISDIEEETSHEEDLVIATENAGVEKSEIEEETSEKCEDNLVLDAEETSHEEDSVIATENADVEKSEIEEETSEKCEDNLVLDAEETSEDGLPKEDIEQVAEDVDIDLETESQRGENDEIETVNLSKPQDNTEEDEPVELDEKYKGVVDPELLKILEDDDEGMQAQELETQEIEIKPIEQKVPAKKSLIPTILLLGAVCFGGFYGYKNKDILEEKASVFISSISKKSESKIKKSYSKKKAPISPDVKNVKTINLEKTKEQKLSIPKVEKEIPKVEPVNELPSVADIPKENKVFKNIANNVNKPAVKKPASIDEVITKGFNPSASAVVVQKVSWEIPQEVADNYSVKKYLIMTGKAIKMNLAQDLLFANDMVTNSRIKLKVKFNQSGTTSEIVLRNSSGSSQVDSLILQSVKETISYTKMPDINTNKGLIKLNLIINL